MQYHFEEENNVLKVSVAGRLVASCSEEFKNTMFERLKDSRKVLFDLKGMEHIDSSGLGAIVSLLQWKNTNGGSIKLCCLQPRPRIVFEITKVYRIFDIYDTAEEAMKAFSDAP
ncbi:MAG: STAS domain-containing protein [Lentisphaeria bacterium]|nr:STAS domain-containing protein [Lentisphaeria bacterium]